MTALGHLPTGAAGQFACVATGAQFAIFGNAGGAV